MEEVMKNGMSYEEVNNKLLAIASSLNYENRENYKKYEAEKRKHEIYNPVTDRRIYEYGYEDAGIEYLPGNSEEYLYRRIISNNDLESFFTKEVFEEVYDYAKAEYIGNGIDFSNYFIDKLITYNEYIQDPKKEEKGSNFAEYADNKKQEEREAEKRQHEQAIKEMQDNFVDKTPEELQKMYDDSKEYIDFKYDMFVSSHGLDNVISFDEFLKIYDKADRDYSGYDIGIDGRVLQAVLEAYYEKFNLEGKIDLESFKSAVINPIHHGAEYRDYTMVPEKLKYEPGKEDVFREALEKMGVDIDNYELNNMFENTEEEKEQDKGLSL
ncbi:MAG: hypothetical protein IKG58_00620 [Bacilli bacterium]|nr:hypothetical protein [Bacilli bacterium]